MLFQLTTFIVQMESFSKINKPNKVKHHQLCLELQHLPFRLPLASQFEMLAALDRQLLFMLAIAALHSQYDLFRRFSLK